jgi:4-methyl-5(b-hydroxyethyl)-thiazole monophosphate biosynthesis
MKRAVVVLAEGFEEIEAVTPIDLLRRAGVEVEVAGLSSLTVVGARSVAFSCDLTLDQVSPGWDMLILPGGATGAKNLAGSPLVKRCLDETLGRNAWIAAICAAPALVLGAQGYLEDRDYTCYPGNENAVLGGRYRTDAVVLDGWFVTSRGVATAPAFALKLIELLAGTEKAKAVAEAVLLA